MAHLTFLTIISLVPIHVVKLEQDLGVRDFHITQSVQHFLDAIESLFIGNAHVSSS